MSRSLKFGLVMPPIFPPRMQVSLARAFEWMGFDALWYPDHLTFPDFMPAPDPWSIIAASALQTKRILFGTAVSDPHRQHPAAFAHRLATVDQLSKGRIILGLGTGEVMNLDPFGIPWDRRLGRMREAVTVMRGLLDSDAPFDFNGEFFQVSHARLSVRPYKRRRLPIYLGALGPKAQKFAGQVADGWVPTTLPAAFYAEYFAPIATAAREAGRDPNDIRRCAMMTVALTDRPGPVLDLMREHAMGLIWPPVAERMGLVLDAPQGSEHATYATVNPHDPDSLRAFRAKQDSIPNEVLERFVFIGDVRRIRRAIGEYVDAGVDHFHITNASLDPTAILTIANEIVPYFKKRRAPASVFVVGSAARAVRGLGLIKDADPVKAMAWLKQQQ